MDAEASTSPLELERSISQASVHSTKSQRSATVRATSRRRGKLTSQPSSSAASIAESDKSLVSFPSFSPVSPRDEGPSTPSSPSPAPVGDGADESTPSAATSYIQPPTPQEDAPTRPAAIVETLLTADKPLLSSTRPRTALFEDDAPVFQQNLPGALHVADDAHIKRLIERHGALGLVRSIAEDLAARDAQITALRRRSDERERALRKIILECGLSNMDLETRLKAIEREARSSGARKGGVEELVEDAMAEDFVHSSGLFVEENGATIRARNTSNVSDADNKATSKGWKEYLWGMNKNTSSRASSVNGDNGKQTVIKAPAPDRRPTIQEDLFSPPEQASVRSSSRASSIHSVSANRKTSLASSVLRMVAGGGASTGRDPESRGRANSSNAGGSLRTPSASSARTNASARAVSNQGGPKGALAAMRRTATQHNIQTVSSARSQPQERWDTMASDPSGELAARPESYGPVEMDSILPPEEQPPTLTRLYNNYAGSEYLTDRFGFIYDQRRKKRQREAQQVARQFKRGSRTEMLTNGRANISPVSAEDGGSVKWDAWSDDRPSTPSSAEEARDESRPKRWQDYLKIATFPTELLSHTPSISAPTIEVLEGAELPPPRSPGLIAAEDDRGFIPPAITATAAVSEEPATVVEEPASGTLVKEDAEPVRILLQQLSEVHDGLQREKTIRWNDFLRKVRAERRREGEAANASAAEAAAARFQKATAMMPEARVADGELIGVANWANKGKVGRAKWNEFNRLVLGGIPVLIRSKIWAECSGALNMRIPGYYDDLVNRAELDDNPEVAQQIRADINRTLTDNIFFRKGPGVQKLNEVLLAYSRRNPEVGYCQGMNLITANLLLIMPSAEEAFWILVCIIEKILPSGYYDHSLLASRADQQVLRGYVAEVLPRLSAHFDELGIALETMTFQWFLSVFTDCLSAEALFRVWDVVLCFGDGSTFLFQVALALLKLNEQQLLGCDSPAAVYTYINHQMTNHAISIDGLLQASEGLRRVVKREDVDGRREKAIEAEQELVRQREERLRAYKERKAAAASASAVVDKAVEAQPAAPESEETATSETVTADNSAQDPAVQEPAPIEEEAG
ncbi:TBC domain-containing protein [Diaporthe amygdali]|uniref:TBC domain-containing protein n=1 Tax=Phomopsis amygdali TaxID=1214568 RepID=UPI0022FF091B|nr:TBC domain-containing protein [Diaporthe amygdali]KAJ0124692.1 TBC domain-containing protein [Diaporthe amygdali]